MKLKLTKNLFPKPKPIKHGKEFTTGKKLMICSKCGFEEWVTDKICQERKDLQFCSTCYATLTARRRYHRKKGEKYENISN